MSGSVLEVTVLNRTDESNTQLGTGEYAISEIYFNATSNVSALTLTSPSSGWSLQTNQRGGGEFGRFDFALVGDLARNEHPSIAAGDSLVFQFDISGTGPFDMTDFLSVESTTPPGTMPQIAQAKFVQGPEDDSAFGASGISWVVYQPKVPEPGATLLVAVGVAGVILRSRPGNALALSRRRSPRG